MKIQSLNIDVNQMPTAATARRFTVNGIIGSEFKMIVLQNPSSSSSQLDSAIIELDPQRRFSPYEGFVRSV